MAVSEKGRVVCPNCGRETSQRVLPETEARRLPVFCKLCKKAFITDILPEPEPEPKGQSQSRNRV